MSRLRTALSLFTGRGFPGPDPDAPGRYKGYETPRYGVERTIGAVEVRLYPATLRAETDVAGADPDAALREGFRRLAGYIFGGNEGGRKVAMTAPVEAAPETIAMTTPVEAAASGGGRTIAFILPSDLTEETAPRPRDSRVRLVTAPSERRAVLAYPGRSGWKRQDQKAAELRAVLRKAGVAFNEPPLAMTYDDPSTLPPFRRNEVAFRLD